MTFEPPLVEGVLIRRYKRFLADIDAGGERFTVHCPNTGAMLGCASPGARVWYSTSDSARRKYRHTLELVAKDDGALVGVNTARANRIVAEALGAGLIPGLEGGRELRAEVTMENGTRLDFAMRVGDLRTWLEVKSVTLARDGVASFPDAVSMRAKRHVEVLAERVAAGDRAVLVFCVQHTRIRRVTTAADIDPGYDRALRQAVATGVEVHALACDVDPTGIRAVGALPVSLPGPTRMPP